MPYETFSYDRLNHLVDGYSIYLMQRFPDDSKLMDYRNSYIFTTNSPQELIHIDIDGVSKKLNFNLVDFNAKLSKLTININTSHSLRTNGLITEQLNDFKNIIKANNGHPIEVASIDNNKTNDSQKYFSMVLSTNRAFIAFKMSDRDGRNEPKDDTEMIILKQKLKFHISLPEDTTLENRIQRVRGWEIVKNILMKNEVDEFKIIRPDLKMSDQIEQRGRDITIYAHADLDKKPSDWFRIIEEISQELSMAGIKPGYTAVNEKLSQTQIKAVEGSHYACYGYEKGLKKGAKVIKDVCEGLHVTVNNKLKTDSTESSERKIELGSTFSMGMK